MDRSAGVISTPSSSTFFFKIRQRAPFALVAAGCTVLLSFAALPGQAQSSVSAKTKPPGSIQTPAQARALGLDSLHRAVRQDKGVPLPSQLDQFVKDRSGGAVGQGFVLGHATGQRRSHVLCELSFPRGRGQSH